MESQRVPTSPPTSSTMRVAEPAILEGKGSRVNTVAGSDLTTLDLSNRTTDGSVDGEMEVTSRASDRKGLSESCAKGNAQDS